MNQYKPGSGKGGFIVAILVALMIPVVLASALLAAQAVGRSASAAGSVSAAACEEAVAGVQQHRVPGQDATVEDLIRNDLLRESQAVRVDRVTVRFRSPDRCEVRLYANVGDQQRVYGWMMRIGTGEVSPLDEHTRRVMSGLEAIQ
jgi:hypothetical protein